ncbi:MAG: GGDEF domain-containing protein [Acidobacteriia bacterium]|nr:GGDEF domain-containing protein [Terriglobia bacterium]
MNDHFGQLVGNKVLQLVAAGLQESCREYDYVARMGGDEFVLVLPGLRPQDLEDKLRRIESVVRDSGAAVCKQPLIAISAGAAFYPEDGGDAESLLAEADRRMYAAKQSHKNRPASTGLAALQAALGAPTPESVK